MTFKCIAFPCYFRRLFAFEKSLLRTAETRGTRAA
jgi:hypothetical protein